MRCNNATKNTAVYDIDFLRISEWPHARQKERKLRSFNEQSTFVHHEDQQRHGRGGTVGRSRGGRGGCNVKEKSFTYSEPTTA